MFLIEPHESSHLFKISFLLVLIPSFFLVYRFWGVYDFPQGDYASYVLLFRHSFSAKLLFSSMHMSPLYSLFLAFIETLTKSPMLAYYIQTSLIIILVTVTTYYSLSRVLPRSLAYGLLLLFATSLMKHVHLTLYFIPLILTNIAILLSNRKNKHSVLIIYLTLFTSLFFRIECLLFLIANILYFALSDCRENRCLGRKISIHYNPVTLISIIVLIGSIAVLFPSRTKIMERSQLAFIQHFAKGYLARKDDVSDSFMRCYEIAADIFHCREVSAWKAFFINPRETVTHVVYNTCQLPRTMMETLFPIRDTKLAYYVLFILCLLFLVTTIRNRKKIDTIIGMDKSFNYFLLTTVFLLPPIIIYSRSELLLPLVPLGLVITALPFKSFFTKLDNRGLEYWCKILFLTVFLLTILGQELPSKKPIFELGETLNRLPTLRPTRRYRLLSSKPEARAICAVTWSKRLIPLELWAAKQSDDPEDKIFENYLANTIPRPHLILVTDDLKNFFNLDHNRLFIHHYNKRKMTTFGALYQRKVLSLKLQRH